MKHFLNPTLAVLALLASTALFAQAGGPDLIAVAATGRTPSAAVSSQAGRSPYFLLFDKQGTFVEAVDNPFKDGQTPAFRPSISLPARAPRSSWPRASARRSPRT